MCFSNGKVRVNLEDYKWQTNSLTSGMNNSDRRFISVVQTFHLSWTPPSPCEGVSLPIQSGVRKTVIWQALVHIFSFLRWAFQSSFSEDTGFQLQVDSTEIGLKDTEVTVILPTMKYSLISAMGQLKSDQGTFNCSPLLEQKWQDWQL